MSSVTTTFTSVLQALDHHALHRADRTAVIYLGDRGEIERSLTYAELRACALRVSGALAQRFPVGSRAALLFPSGLDFLATFLGCLYAGVIPAPLSVPRSAAGLGHLRGLIENCGPSA